MSGIRIVAGPDVIGTEDFSQTQADAANEIVDYIAEYQHTSFAEMMRIMESHGIEKKGDVVLSLPEFPNMILWGGISDEAADILQVVLVWPGIVLKPSSQLVYLIDGGLLRFPLAKRLHNYKKPHWLPITLSLEEAA